MTWFTSNTGLMSRDERPLRIFRKSDHYSTFFRHNKPLNREYYVKWGFTHYRNKPSSMRFEALLTFLNLADQDYSIINPRSQGFALPLWLPS
jgi:hypothetical protein